MVIKEQQITREQLKEARQRGRLVDLGREAYRAGFDCRCTMSESLYRSLFWKYPGAGEEDIVAVGDLLNELQSRLQCSRLTPGKPFYYLRPPRPTWWLQSRYCFKLLVLYRGQRVESVVIMSQLNSVESLFADLAPPLPASLLASMMLSIERLGTLSFRSERPLVRSLAATARELLQRSPLQAEISLYLDQQQPSEVPSQFSRLEYRELVLRSLLEQLELTAAVAEKMGAELSLPVSGVLQLLANYVGFVPPTEDMALPGDKQEFH